MAPQELLLVLVLVVVLALLVAGWGAAGRIAACLCPPPPAYTGGRAARGPAEPFPYLRDDLPPAAEMFAALAASRPAVLRQVEDRGTVYDMVVTRTWPADFHACDALSCHFTEEVRARCRFGAKPAPVTAWRTRQAQIQAAARRLGAKAAEPVPRTMLLREALLEQTRWCNLYNPAFCLWLYRRLGDALGLPPSKVRILDPSSGWGDRLLAACAYGAAAYQGFDPNSELREAYRRIIGEFAPAAGRYAVETAPFTAAGLEALGQPQYHIVHTSPPFFDLEDYPAEGGAHARPGTTYPKWRDAFYRPYLLAAWDALEPGGYFCLYIDNVMTPAAGKAGAPLADDAHAALAQRGAERAGVYGFRQDGDYPPLGNRSVGRVRSAHVWKKPPLGAQQGEAFRSPNLVVDTLNLTHYLLGRGLVSGGLSTETIVAAIDYSAPILSRAHPGRLVYVTKDRDATAAEGEVERALESVARRRRVAVHYVRQAPANDWRGTGEAAPTHQKKGRDDFYMGILARQLRCAVLTDDSMRDFQKLKTEVPPFQVRVFSYWERAPTTEHVRPNAPDYARVRAPPRIRMREAGFGGCQN